MIRLYRAVCEWLEASTEEMRSAAVPERESAVDSLVEHAHAYTSEPEMHSGYRGTSLDDDDGGVYRAGRISLRWNPPVG